MKEFLAKDPFFLALLIVVLLLPFAQVKWVSFGVPLYLPEIALLIACGFWAFTGFRRALGEWLFFQDGLATLGIGLFVSGAVLSTLTHPWTLTSLGMLKSWFFFPVLAAWLIFFEARNPLKRRGFLWGWFGILVLTALGSLAYVFFGILTFDGRLTGGYPSPNFLAFFIAPAVPLALYLGSASTESCCNVLWKRILLSLGSLVVMTCLFFTHSYGVWVALIVSVALFLVGLARLRGLGWSTKLLFLAFLIGGATFFFLEYGSVKWQALTSFESRSSLSSRMMIWRATEKIFEDQPFLGIGLGRFQEVYLAYQQYFPPYLEWAVPEPHNWYAAVALGTGSLGLLGFLLLIGRFLFLVGKTWFLAEQKEKRLAALFYGSLFLLFFVYGMTDTPYFKNDLVLSFFLMMALGFAQIKGEAPRQELL